MRKFIDLFYIIMFCWENSQQMFLIIFNVRNGQGVAQSLRLNEKKIDRILPSYRNEILNV